MTSWDHIESLISQFGRWLVPIASIWFATHSSRPKCMCCFNKQVNFSLLTTMSNALFKLVQKKQKNVCLSSVFQAAWNFGCQPKMHAMIICVHSTIPLHFLCVVCWFVRCCVVVRPVRKNVLNDHEIFGGALGSGAHSFYALSVPVLTTSVLD